MAMATQTRAANWKFPAGKVQSQSKSPPIGQKPTTTTTPTFSQVRQKLEESRKLFLHQQHALDEEETERICEEKPIVGAKLEKSSSATTNDSDSDKGGSKGSRSSSVKKEVLRRLNSTSSNQNCDEQSSRRPTKKISFKIRKNASIYRRKAPDLRPLNLVQELTKKYNELDEQRAHPSAILSERLEKTKVVKRNSQNLKRRPSTKDSNKQHRAINQEKDNKTSVKAAIAIFEQKCTPKDPQDLKDARASSAPPSRAGKAQAKPQIAAKTFDAKAIAMRNQEKRMRLQKKANNGGDEIPACDGAIVADLRNNGDADNRRGSGVDAAASRGSSAAGGDRDASLDKMDAGDVTVEELQVVSLPMAVLKRCESNYECQKFAKYQQARQMSEASVLRKDAANKVFCEVKKTDVEDVAQDKPKTDAGDPANECGLSRPLSLDDDYEFVVPPEDDLTSTEKDDRGLRADKEDDVPPLPPRTSKPQVYSSVEDAPAPSADQPPSVLSNVTSNTDDDYEIPEAPPDEHEENIYESLSRCSRRSSDRFRSRKSSAGLSRNQHEPLPPRPPSSASSTPSMEYENDESNYYESIYSKRDDNYESIYGGSGLDIKRNSISVQSVQSDQQSNSIYGRSITSWAEEVMETYIGSGSCASFSGSSQNGGSVKAVSELSGSSDDWVDISDHECDEDEKRSKFVIVREARHQKVTKKNSGWSQRIRGQWNKVPKKMHHGDTDSDHTYETLYGSDGLPLGAQDGGHAHRQAAYHPQQLHHRPATHDAEGHPDDDDDFDSFESDSESDNSFAKTDSGVDMGNTQLPEPPANQTYAFTRFAASAGKNVMKRLRRNWSMRKNDISKSLSRITKRKSRTDLDTIEQEAAPPAQTDKSTVGRRGFLDKFKRSMSMTGDVGDNFADRPKSTFYVTDPIDVDAHRQASPVERPERRHKPNLVRPPMPPPPAPTSPTPSASPSQRSRSQSWYAECGVFKPDSPAPALPRRPNSFWYAEVGLYQSGSPPSTGTTSSENSGSSATSAASTASATYGRRDQSDDCYAKNYYNASVKSYDSCDTKKDEAFNSLQGDIQLRLQDEPLYQFYDAAVLESVCNSGLSDMYDDYEEIAKDKRAAFSSRPSAMEIVSPRNNVSVARTLWCEIPEVVQSTVLSTLSVHQKKLQEAKFEMLTSEASYLNSLHVLTEHFVRRLRDSELLNEDDKEILCGKILPVKECSEKLLSDLERCWQENILLHGVCDIVKSHAEENFGVYIAYCENQIVLDQTLKRLKEKPNFVEFLRQLEANSVCQLLTLYSFLMLPMQRITRWPLLVDAILKRLSPQDDEYQSCQYALATLNKIVTRCNEGARNMERITEMRKLAAQMEFGRGVPPFELVNGKRWLVRSGPLTQMLNRGDDVKLTFGKRFTKIPIHLFLFNDIIIVAKSKGDGVYVVQHYCSRSYVELNGESLATLPMKDTQGRHLIFLTILENHEEKTVEMLLSCASESDRERWLEALTPPKSENPEETLYECWDCPQVTAIHNYIANQPDELPITRGDVINVTRKMADGWYHGERIRDGETGWFPANYTVEVANPHVRARNLKQRYRLLAYSENYLKSK